ncbi:MAG: anhydro-N-acetylmuramic acid kinase [Robiginitomaculum sp.]
MSKIYKAIGLMSGTSLDGVDAAVLETDGRYIHTFGKTCFRPYNKQEKKILGAATQDALKWGCRGAKPNSLKQAEAIVDNAHIDAIEKLGVRDIDLIGYHGQTVLHKAPNGEIKGNTLQLGNGQVLADYFGIDVVYDFRSADVNAGGQGAPFAPIYHKALLMGGGAKLPAAILNIGGVSNITILTKQGELLASDCGPGNGPLDTWVQKCGIGEYDDGGRLAMQGKADFVLIDKWLERGFFTKPVPKSADRWDFDVLEDLREFSPQDGAMSLASFTVLAIKRTLGQYDIPLEKVIVGGGGRHNEVLLWLLRVHTGIEVRTAEDVGWKGDDLESQAFAYLAVRSFRSLPLSFPTTTGVAKPQKGGSLASPFGQSYG